MSKIRLMLSLMVLIFLLPLNSFSQIQETKEYKVLKGDTLWDISKKELSDSFLWPKIWKENPAITNPDKVYPGQIIIIPLYLIQPEKKEVEEAAPAPPPPPAPPTQVIEKETPPPAVKLRPLVDRNLLIASGYIAPSVHRVGTITGAPSGRTLYGVNDKVYVRTDESAAPGDKFYVIRAEQTVYHPITKGKVGYVVQILGIAEITQLKYGETEAKLTQCYGDIVSGDLLDTYYEITPPLVEGNSFRRPDIEGFILASENMRLLNSNLDIVFIDKGKQDGVEIGDEFRTLKRTDGGHIVPSGIIQVINYKDTTATAVVKEAGEPLSSGNVFTQLD
jgi:hypothetical protein